MKRNSMVHVTTYVLRIRLEYYNIRARQAPLELCADCRYPAPNLAMQCAANERFAYSRLLFFALFRLTW
jgi:hypothetical protein